MDCEFKNKEAFIEKYLRKELNEDDQSLFEEHYMSCEECFSELESVQQMMEMLQEEGENLFPEYNNKPESYARSKFKISDLIKKIFPPKWYLQPSPAYAFIAASLIIFGIYLLNPSVEISNNTAADEQITSLDNEIIPQADENSTSPNQTEIENKTPQIELYAANFVESDDLEYLIDQRFRGSEDIRVISPENGITITEKILFNWVPETEHQLYLKILNNEEDVLFNLTPDKNKLLFNITENKLAPGLYYWKLESDEDLLHIGKFLLKE